MASRGGIHQSTVRRRLADYIWQWRKVVYVISAGLAALVLAAIFLSISLPDAIPELSTELTFFDGDRSFRAAEELAGVHPERPVGSEESSQAASWLEERLGELGLGAEVQTFDADLGEDSRELRNVVVTLPGQSAETLVISAPRADRLDTPLTPVANASGTAMLLELAQTFFARPHEKTIVLLSTEGGGYGGLGLKKYLDSLDGVAVKSVLSIQGLGKAERTRLTAGVMGENTVTPGWYVQLTQEILRKAEISLELPGLGHQIAGHALRLEAGEQVAGLEKGIPTISLFDLTEGTLTPEAMANQGAAIERLILTLDRGTAVPEAAPAALVLPSGRYLTHRALNVLAYLMLLPSGVMALTWLAVIQIRPESWLRYIRNVLSFVLPVAAVLGLAVVAGHTGLLPRFEGAAPWTSAEATEPKLPLTLGLLIAGLVTFIVSRHFLGYLKPREPVVMAEMAKLGSGLLVLLAGLALLASHSPFSLLTAITAAWLWPLATCFFEPKYFSFGQWPRLRHNAGLLLAGLIAPLTLYAYLALETPLGWLDGWWYLLVQTVSGAYGVRGPLATALLTASFLLLMGVRRLRLLPVETLERREGMAAVPAPWPRVRRI